MREVNMFLLIFMKCLELVYLFSFAIFFAYSTSEWANLKALYESNADDGINR